MATEGDPAAPSKQEAAPQQNGSKPSGEELDPLKKAKKVRLESTGIIGGQECRLLPFHSPDFYEAAFEFIK